MFFCRLHVRMTEQDLDSADRNALLQQPDCERVAKPMRMRVDLRKRAQARHRSPQTSEQARQFAVAGPEEVLGRFHRHRIERTNDGRRERNVNRRSCFDGLSQEQAAIFGNSGAPQLPGVGYSQSGIQEQQNESAGADPSAGRGFAVVVLDLGTGVEQCSHFILREWQRRRGVFDGRLQYLGGVVLQPALRDAERAERAHKLQFGRLSGRHDLAAGAVSGEQLHVYCSQFRSALPPAEREEWRESHLVSLNGSGRQMACLAVSKVGRDSLLYRGARHERLLGVALDFLHAPNGLIPVAESEGSAVRRIGHFAYRPYRALTAGEVLSTRLEAARSHVTPVQPEPGCHGTENTTKRTKAGTSTVRVVQSVMKPLKTKGSDWGGIWDSNVSAPCDINDLPLFHGLESDENTQNSRDAVRVGTRLYYTHETVPLPPGIDRKVVSYQWQRHEEWLPCLIPADPLLPRKAIEALEQITKDPPSFGYVYILEAEGLGRVKIGESWRSPEAGRASGVQTGCPARLRVVRSLYGNRGHEQALHEAFPQERITGEWFHYSRRIRRLVEITTDLDTRMLERFSKNCFIVPSDPSARSERLAMQEWRSFDNAREFILHTDVAQRWAWQCCSLILREGSEEEKKMARKMIRERSKKRGLIV